MVLKRELQSKGKEAMKTYWDNRNSWENVSVHVIWELVQQVCTTMDTGTQSYFNLAITLFYTYTIGQHQL